jgi:putative oxidoreductase
MIALGLLILRLVAGLTVAAHGAQKLLGWFGGGGITGTRGFVTRLQFRPTELWTWAVILGEFGGGLLMAFGLLSPVGNFGVMGAMAIAISVVHWPKGFFNGKGGIEFPLQLATIALVLSLTGPGPYSLDHLLGISLPEPVTWIVLAVGLIIGVAAALVSRRQSQPESTAPATGTGSSASRDTPTLPSP